MLITLKLLRKYLGLLQNLWVEASSRRVIYGRLLRSDELGRGPFSLRCAAIITLDFRTPIWPSSLAENGLRLPQMLLRVK